MWRKEAKPPLATGFLGLGNHMPGAASEDIETFEKAKGLVEPDYVPSDDDEYMNPRQQAYFQVLLIDWKR